MKQLSNRLSSMANESLIKWPIVSLAFSVKDEEIIFSRLTGESIARRSKLFLGTKVDL